MRRQRLPAAERRKQLLECAIECFALHGLRGATTKRIAARAGVAEALLYRYFGSKHALFAEAVDGMATELLGGLQRLFELHRDDPAAALRAMLELYARTLTVHPHLAKMIFVVSAELDDPAVLAVYLPHQTRALKLISAAIRQWQTRDLIRADVAPRSIAWLILGTWQALALMKHSNQLDTMDLDLASRLAQPFLLAVRPRADAHP